MDILQTRPVKIKDYFDPREPDVQVRVDPDVDPWLVLTTSPLDGATDASIANAKFLQRKERRLAMEADALEAQDDLDATNVLDSVHAEKVAVAMLPLEALTQADRRQAGYVAVRLHDPLWQTVARYRAAQGIEMVLRNFLRAQGASLGIPDQAIREAADRAAGTARQSMLRVLDGTAPVGLHEWAAARLGFLSLGEDR